jgi:Tol biopolymer transport system component
MTMTEARFDRELPVILEDLYLGPTPTYRDEVLAVATHRRQRPAWAIPGRWLPMADIASRPAFMPRLPWRTVGLALMIVAVLLAAVALYAGTRQTRIPPPFGPAGNGLITYAANGELYAGDLTTGQTRLLMASGKKDSAPGYSPDGTRLAFIRSTGPDWPDGKPRPVDIYTMHGDGSNVVKITPSPIDAIIESTWGPDSRTLAVTYWDGGWSRLMILDADGHKPAVNVTTPTNPVNLAFRPPDGKELLFRGKFLYPDDRFGLYVMNADGTNVRTLVEPSTDNWADLDSPTYSADGSRIFYQRWFPNSIQLWVMNADGTDKHEFISHQGPVWDMGPSPSPDGKWIAYFHNIEDTPTTTRHVSVARSDGTGPIIATGPELHGGAHWVWSPDSTRILMYPDDGSGTKAYLLDPQGGPFTTVPWPMDGDIDWQRLAVD